MALKCVHQSCGKTYTNEDEDCTYHPGPPNFHEGQKGWSCCKPRVLTFDEFLAIPPCTTGKHSTTDKPPAVPKSTPADAPLPDTSGDKVQPVESSRAPIRTPASTARAPTATAGETLPAPPPAPVDTSDDDASLPVAKGKICRRKACGQAYSGGERAAEEKCVYHPGAPIFHEGSKGYTCCKRRVLEFDEFLRIEGCQTKPRHLFVGSGGKRKARADGTGAGATASGDDAHPDEELLDSVRHDFYQTGSTVHASFFLKKIDAARSTIAYPDPRTLRLDLVTSDAPPKRYRRDLPLYAELDAERCKHKIMGTKLEVELAKRDLGIGWPTLRSDERGTGEIIQTGRAGRA